MKPPPLWYRCLKPVQPALLGFSLSTGVFSAGTAVARQQWRTAAVDGILAAFVVSVLLVNPLVYEWLAARLAKAEHERDLAKAMLGEAQRAIRAHEMHVGVQVERTGPVN